MAKAKVLKDKQGNTIYPVTDASLILGLKEGFMDIVEVDTRPTASGQTRGKLYMVPSTETVGEYDRYITKFENGSYSWEQLTSTTVPSPVVADNLTTDDATKALSAKQGKVLDGKITQLGQEVNGLDEVINGRSETIEVTTAQSLTANKYYNVNSTTVMPSDTSSSTGCYCAKIPVVAGEIYRVSGFCNKSTAARLYATYASDGTRVRYCVTSSEGVRQSFDLTMQENEAYLIVNLQQYDASLGDGFWKVETQTIQTDGLVEKVENIENNIPSVIDSLDSTSPTDALSANQGQILNEDINGITTETVVDQEVIADKFFNTKNNRIPSKANLASATGVYACYLSVIPGEKYRIYGKGLGATSAAQLYAMADADRYVVENGTPGVAINSRESGYDLTIPEGVAFLVVNLNDYNASTDKVQQVGSTTTECVKTRLAALEQEDIDLTNRALPLSGKKVIFFGDSITEFTYQQKGLVDYFAEASGATCYKAAIGGSRLTQRANPTLTPSSSTEARAALDICNMVEAWTSKTYDYQDAAVSYLGDYSARINAMKNCPIEDTDIVMLVGGGNDFSSGISFGEVSDTTKTTIYGALNTIISTLLQTKPSLKIYYYTYSVGYVSNIRDDAHFTDNYKFSPYDKTKPELIEILGEQVKKYHIPFINNYWDLGWNQLNFSTYFYDTDGTHPYLGFDVLGKRIYQRVIASLH